MWTQKRAHWNDTGIQEARVQDYTTFDNYEKLWRRMERKAYLFLENVVCCLQSAKVFLQSFVLLFFVFCNLFHLLQFVFVLLSKPNELLWTNSLTTFKQYPAGSGWFLRGQHTVEALGARSYLGTNWGVGIVGLASPSNASCTWNVKTQCCINPSGRAVRHGNAAPGPGREFLRSQEKSTGPTWWKLCTLRSTSASIVLSQLILAAINSFSLCFRALSFSDKIRNSSCRNKHTIIVPSVKVWVWFTAADVQRHHWLCFSFVFARLNRMNSPSWSTKVHSWCLPGRQSSKLQRINDATENTFGCVFNNFHNTKATESCPVSQYFLFYLTENHICAENTGHCFVLSCFLPTFNFALISAISA